MTLGIATLSRMPRTVAVYAGPLTLYWDVTGKALPTRSVALYRSGHLHPLAQVWLWRHKDFCDHGYYKPTGAVRFCNLCVQESEYDLELAPLAHYTDTREVGL